MEMWNIGDQCIVDNRNTDYGAIPGTEKYMGKIGVVKSHFKNKYGYNMFAVEFDNGACFVFIEEFLITPEYALDCDNSVFV